MKHNGEHQYYKYPRPSIKDPDKFVWKCEIPGCTHFLQQVDLIVGRFSKCHEPGCKELRLMTEKELELKGKFTFCKLHKLMKLRPQNRHPFIPKVKTLGEEEETNETSPNLHN